MTAATTPNKGLQATALTRRPRGVSGSSSESSPRASLYFTARRLNPAVSPLVVTPVNEDATAPHYIRIVERDRGAHGA